MLLLRLVIAAPNRQQLAESLALFAAKEIANGNDDNGIGSLASGAEFDFDIEEIDADDTRPVSIASQFVAESEI